MNIKVLLVFLFCFSSLAYAQNSKNVKKGMKFHNKGKFEKAIEQYNKELKKEPKDFLTIYNRASCYDALGKYENSLADYNFIYKANPEFTKLLLLIAINNSILGRFQKSVHYYKLALTKEINFNHHDYYNLGSAYYFMEE